MRPAAPAGVSARRGPDGRPFQLLSRPTPRPTGHHHQPRAALRMARCRAPTDALRPRDDDESALLHELLKRPWAMIEELDYTRSFAHFHSVVSRSYVR